ncbi:MAG: DUF1674 domain-containing protein [Gammaproteobacteria bacterium]|nr:DUF1674 domain-containing protein [Gammaproteobacteria bacterium]
MNDECPMNDCKQRPKTERAEWRQCVDASKPGFAQPTNKKEIGGPKGPEPTRYGDWERNGRCTDF